MRHQLESQDKKPIISLDYRHWYYDDVIFDGYAQNVSRLRPPVVSIFQNLYMERPKEISLDVFDKKLYKRTEILVNRIKDFIDDSLILSPAIVDVSKEEQDRYVRYFSVHHEYFDVYTLHCFHDMVEKTFLRTLSTLQKIISTCGVKPIWVTRWSVPSAEYNIKARQTLLDDDYVPYDYDKAAQKLRYIYSLIDASVEGDCKWFFSGTHKDLFRVEEENYGNQLFWNSMRQYFMFPLDNKCTNWYHFTGILEPNGFPKKELLAALIHMINQINDREDKPD